MKTKLLTLFLGAMCFALQVMAQQQTITGKVTSSEDKLPMPGVTVRVKGSATATQTANDGTYKITAKNSDILQFAYLGRTAQEKVVGSSKTINIALQSTENDLSEVVVVGYGTQKKVNLTGAITTVDVKKSLEGRPIADVGRALQGVASGLSVTIPSGEVGSDPIIKIRGQIGSIRGGSSPLILLDNVEIPSIQLVNPNDIASITVLKDAAAASIYGAKGAFGVVLITTKQGSDTGKPQITYTNNFSFQNPWKELKMGDVNALKYTVDAAERVGTFTPVGAFYQVDRASYLKAVEWKEKYGKTLTNDDPTVFGRDWFVQGAGNTKMGVRTYDPYEALIKEWAPSSQHNISVGGSSGKTNYNVGLAMLDQSGMIKPAKSDQFTRYNASLRLSSELNKYITVRGGALLSRRNKEYPYATSSTTADAWYYLYRWGSLYPLGKDENGDPIRSPASELAAGNTANILQNYVNVNLGSTVKIQNNWKVDFDYTLSNQDQTWKKPGTRFTARDSWSAPIARVDGNGQPVYVNNEGQVVPNSPTAIRAFDLANRTYTALGSNPDHFYRFAENFLSHTINAFTTYDLNLNNDNQFKFILGLNRVESTTENQFSQVTNLTDITNPQYNFGVGTVTAGSDKYQEAQLGYFGRVNYAYKNKYLVEANLRYDGSSKFPKELWWRWFPSFSAGWVVSEESFMTNTKSVINFLKFRGSWGSIGDQTVPNSLYIPTMGSGAINWISGGNKFNYVGTPPAVSRSITWQDIVSSNIGVDATFLNNKLTVTADLFKRNTNNMIVPAEGLPLTLGVGAPQSNYGSLSTKGWELSVDFNHRFKNGLGVNFKGNISDAKSTITAYGSSQSVNANYVGRTFGEIWGYRTDRLYQVDDFELDGAGKPFKIQLTPAESALYGKATGGPSAYKLKTVNGQKPVYQTYLQNNSAFFFGPGDVKFKDVNGDGELNNGTSLLNNHGDLEMIGNSTPRYEYGFRLGSDYKGIDISAFFQGVGSRKMWGNSALAIPGFNTADGAMAASFVDDYWSPQNTGAFYPAAFNNGNSNSQNNLQVQDRYLLNLAYLRLKSLTLGYTFPQKMFTKVGVRSFRVYTALENIITWDNLNGLPIDPETSSSGNFWNDSNYNSGRTALGVPAFKSVSFGLQLNF